MIQAKTLKGFRDFLPEEALKRQYVINKLRHVFELYGFDPLETPALEYAEVLLGKYGSEADKLLYIFKDRGDREIGLRYDQTVPTARVMAQYYSELPSPFKRYQIQPVWRAENTQKGRYREFLQCDADIIGPKSFVADAEILATFATCYETLGIDYEIRYNSRELLFSLLNGFVSDDKKLSVLQSLDKLDKKSELEVKEELYTKGITQQEVDDIFDNIRNLDETRDTWLSYVIQMTIERFGIPKERLRLEPTLVRGLDYYTGIIFEAGIRGQAGGSLGGGGRYDNLIEQMGGPSIQAVGFAIGFDRTIEAVSEAQAFNKEKTATKVLVAIAKDEDGAFPYALDVLRQLRKENIPSEIYCHTTQETNLPYKEKMEKQLKYAEKKGIPYAVVIGPEEAKYRVMNFKNLNNWTEKEKISIEDVINDLR